MGGAARLTLVRGASRRYFGNPMQKAACHESRDKPLFHRVIIECYVAPPRL